MVPFIIVADLRTGSTLLSSSLDLHPQVRCYGELFHTQDLPDNQLADGDRHQLSGRQMLRHVFSTGEADAVGFRAMIFLPLPSAPQWSDAWDGLREVDGLRVIALSRRNRLAQFASIRVAEQAGTWHPSPGDPVLRPENRPTVTIDPDEFRRWRQERDELFAFRRERLGGRPTLHVDYETLAGEWTAAIRQIQEFLGVNPIELEQVKQVQERRPLSEVIVNYDEIASYDDTLGGRAAPA